MNANIGSEVNAPAGIGVWLCVFFICLTPTAGLAQTFSVLHTFSGGSDGSDPQAGLVLVGNALYGTTSYGGAFGKGTVFRMNKDGSGYTVLHDFAGGNDGAAPIGFRGHLLLSSNVLYGTTIGEFEGGLSGTNFGTVFQIGVDGTGYAVLKNFHGPDGAEPSGALVTSGTTLYGTTFYGGSTFVSWVDVGYGTMFSLNTDGSGFNIITNYTKYGQVPNRLVLAGDTLYATAQGDGGWDGGSVFTMNTNGSGFTFLKQFPAVYNGYNYFPAGVTLSGSTLYGTTSYGSNTISESFIGWGSVFTLNTDGSGFSFLHFFSGGSDGGAPNGPPLLVGTTLFGATQWSLFQMNTDGSEFAVLKDFSTYQLDGNLVSGDIIFSDGVLYGTAASGGVSNAGVVFSVSLPAPSIQSPIPSQTAEEGSSAAFSAPPSTLPVWYGWFFNETNLLDFGTNSVLQLSNLAPSQSGAYTLVITNVVSAVTSAPAMLSIIPPVPKKKFGVVTLAGQPGTTLHLDSAGSVASPASWSPLATVVLTNSSQIYLDDSQPLSSQGFYRAWQSAPASAPSSLNLNLVTAITLSGAIGDTLRLDYINQIGPTNAWVALATVTLTNTSQLYFDFSAWRQPPRLYRIVQGP